MTKIGRPEADKPCRRCRHYDCMMDRGEPLPEHVIGYVNGVLYQPSPEAPVDADVADAVSSVE